MLVFLMTTGHSKMHASCTSKQFVLLLTVFDPPAVFPGKIIIIAMLVRLLWRLHQQETVDVGMWLASPRGVGGGPLITGWYLFIGAPAAASPSPASPSRRPVRWTDPTGLARSAPINRRSVGRSVTQKWRRRLDGEARWTDPTVHAAARRHFVGDNPLSSA